MTVQSIMTSRVVALGPDDEVADALRLMHEHHIRNLPVVDAERAFIGLFGIRRLARLLLPDAGKQFREQSIADLAFLPEDTGRMAKRWRKAAARPVSEFMEKEKKLLFCTPDTPFPQMLKLLDRSKDSSLPVIVLQGGTRKLAGIVSVWDVMDGLVMRLLTGSDGDAGTRKDSKTVTRKSDKNSDS